jgi:hypothetical protein
MRKPTLKKFCKKAAKALFSDMRTEMIAKSETTTNRLVG